MEEGTRRTEGKEKEQEEGWRETIGVRGNEQSRGRGTLKQWEEKGGWVKERGTVRYSMQFESLDPADPDVKCIFAFMWLVPLTNKLCQLNNRNLIHECLQCALLYSL